MNAERRVQRVRAAIAPRAQSRPDWQILCGVASAMGHARGLVFRSAFVSRLIGPHGDAITHTPEYKITAVRIERLTSRRE